MLHLPSFWISLTVLLFAKISNQLLLKARYYYFCTFYILRCVTIKIHNLKFSVPFNEDNPNSSNYY